jgi:hypothetical protein
MLPETAKELQGSGALPGPTKVNGVRIYTGVATTEDSVFYSRRGDGPYYRWLFEEQAGKWRVSRVIDAAFTRQSLSLATWKNVPATLQTRLGEHYLE